MCGVKQIKLYLLTGFLGSGKTTFLKNIMGHLAHRKIGIIINEFGSIGIDGKLVENEAVDLLEINNGSVFCSCLKGEFINGLIACSELPIDYLFVEASGMADPSSIQHILQSVVGKVRGQSYDYRGSISIVDAPHFLAHIDLWTAIEKQIAASDVIVINKLDMINDETFAAVQKKILSINPQVNLCKSSYCNIDFGFLERDIRAERPVGPEESCNTPGNRPHAVTLLFRGILDQEKFEDFLAVLAADAFRIKGFFHLTSGWKQVDVVDGQIDIKPTKIVCDKSQLVIISRKGLPMLNAIFSNWGKRFTEKMVLKQ
ncbi:MAG: CobW family GTP-binding protein [Veillonellales bacterium]